MITPANAQPSRDRGALGRVAVKLFLGITDQWNLTDAQRLVLAGHKSPTMLNQWRLKVAAGEGIRLPRDALERLSYVAGIYKALQLIFPSVEQWVDWVHRPNRDFGGRSTLDRMLSGRVTDLADVRRYLDAHILADEAVGPTDNSQISKPFPIIAYQEELPQLTQPYAHPVAELEEQAGMEINDEYEALYQSITSLDSRDAADALFSAEGEDLRRSYRPGRTEST